MRGAVEVLTGERLQPIAREMASSMRGVSRGRPFVDELDVTEELVTRLVQDSYDLVGDLRE